MYSVAEKPLEKIRQAEKQPQNGRFSRRKIWLVGKRPEKMAVSTDTFFASFIACGRFF